MPESLTAAERACLLRGLALFHKGAFFEAHEEIEVAWTHCRTGNRRFLQAIIHVAVGCHHHVNGNALGRERQFRKAIRKLQEYPAGHAGLDTASLLRHLHAAQLAKGSAPWDSLSLRVSIVEDESNPETKR
jgi:predicted metal-dependent hydrolase